MSMVLVSRPFRPPVVRCLGGEPAKCGCDRAWLLRALSGGPVWSQGHDLDLWRAAESLRTSLGCERGQPRLAHRAQIGPSAAILHLNICILAIIEHKHSFQLATAEMLGLLVGLLQCDRRAFHRLGCALDASIYHGQNTCWRSLSALSPESRRPGTPSTPRLKWTQGQSCVGQVPSTS